MKLNTIKHFNFSLSAGSRSQFILSLAALILVISACSDELSTRGSRHRNVQNQNTSPDSSSSQNFLTDETSPFLARSWPQAATVGYIADICPPVEENKACQDDSSAVIAAVDIMSRALHTHASISIEEAVATVIKLSALHPKAKILAILSQIAKCSQKISSPEYEAALKTYKDHINSVRYLSAGRRKFLAEKGITVPTISSDDGDDDLLQQSKLSLRDALNRFGDRSIPMGSGQVDIDGKPILSAGALRCSRELTPFVVQKFVNEAAAYPVSLSIIPPQNSQSIIPGVATIFEAKLTNTYDTSNLTWSIEEELGSFSSTWGTTQASLTINKWIAGPTSSTVRLQYFSYEGNLNAETPIKISSTSGGTTGGQP